jgi:hypothetical protein
MRENEKPLTLSELINYNQKVLLPVIENRFCVVEDRSDRVENRLSNVEERMSNVENRLSNVENKLGDVMLSFDHVFKKLDILIESKEVRDYQHDREKRLWQIMVDSLKTNRLLTNKQQKEIDDLEVI